MFAKLCANCKQQQKKERERFRQAQREIITLVGKVGSEGGDLDSLKASVEKIAALHNMDKPIMESLLVAGWENVAKIIMKDGILSEDEERPLHELADYFSLPQQSLARTGAFTRLTQNAALREVLNDKISDRIHIFGDIPFNLQRAEKLVWLFKNVEYFEEKTRTRNVGGSQGVSIRGSDGVWFRANAFEGERVQTRESVHVDTGLLGVTDQHLYFSGPSKGLRINYNKIAAFRTFANGFGVQRDALTARLQSFVVKDPQFAYNLIRNLARIACY